MRIKKNIVIYERVKNTNKDLKTKKIFMEFHAIDFMIKLIKIEDFKQ